MQVIDRRRAPPSGAGTILTLWIFGMTACANPFPPTGGPEDRTPPAIELTVPPDQAVDVSADELEIMFSEHVDASSFVRAFSITPDFGEPLEYAWSGRRVRIRLPSPLRENTTYLMQINSDLRDLRGVRVQSPITIAFSTGSEINRGAIRGRVRGPLRGEGVPNVDIFAYARSPSTSLPERPDYRTQSDGEGGFELQYLPEGTAFFVAVVADENRNQMPDAPEAYAPPPRPEIVADTLGGEAPQWVLTRADTIPTEAVRARALSSRRLAVRFSGRVRVLDLTGDGWRVTSSDGGEHSVRAVYVSVADEREVVAETDSLPAGAYEIRVAAVVDSAGNAVRAPILPYDAPARADTARVRFLGFGPGARSEDEIILPPDVQPVVRFSMPPSREALDQMVTVRDSAGAERSFVPHTSTGTSWSLEIDPRFRPGEKFSVQIRAPGAPDTVHVGNFTRMSPADLGEISGHVRYAYPDSVLVEVRSASSAVVRRSVAAESGAFLIDELPAGEYRLRAFVDRDGSSDWSGGFLSPYVRPEPITWSADSVRVRARWETALPDTLNLD